LPGSPGSWVNPPGRPGLLINPNRTSHRVDRVTDRPAGLVRV
jgi:hypothetical protein